MAYVHDINPFDGILCQPFYYIFLLIFISWISAILEIPWLLFMDKITQKTQKYSMSKITPSQFYSQFKSKCIIQLSSINFQIDTNTSIKLHPEIISLILDFLPKENEYTSHCINKKKQKITRTSYIMGSTMYIYHIVRNIANFINFIFIMERYTSWYNDNTQRSNWDKYCSFIICLYYMPNWKVRGSCTGMLALIFLSESDAIKFSNKLCGMEVKDILLALGVAADGLFWTFTILASYPIWFSALFVYLPTLLLFFVVYGLVYMSILMTDHFDNVVVIMIICFFAIPLMFALYYWYWITTMMSGMELYSGQNGWVKSYGIGFFGEYCRESDYVDFGRWNEYPLDIQFLIVSWILF